MAQCTSTAQFFHLRSPLARFHYSRGIQEVMASRRHKPIGHFKFSGQTFRVIVLGMHASARREVGCNHERVSTAVHIYLLTVLQRFKAAPLLGEKYVAACF